MPRFEGALDEVRISNLARSADWVAAQYASMTGSLVTYGFEQSVEGVLANDFDRDGDALTVTQLNGVPGAIGVPTVLASGAIVTLNADGSFIYNTNASFDWVSLGSTTTDSFTYRVDDGNGNTNSSTVTLTIHGSNDGPVAVDAAAGTTENAVLNSNVPAASDVDGTIASYAPGGTNVALGTLLLNGDGSYSFDPGTDFDDLAVGETRDVTFTYTATDNDGAVSAEQTVTITVTGTNDLPTIVDVADINFNEAVNASAQNLTASGTVNFDDVDATDLVDITTSLTSPAVWNGGVIDASLKVLLESGFSASVTNAAAPGSTGWNYTANNANLDFLATGETITLTFTLTATDSTGATTSDLVTITIIGASDAPFITDGPDSVGLAETNSDLSTSGDLTINDADINNTVAASIDSLVVTGTSNRTDPLAPSDAALLTMFNISPTDILDNLTDILDATEDVDTLNWTFISGAETFDYLAAGETLILEYTVRATDDDGIPLSDTETVTITITGSNDDPVFSIVDVVGDITEGATLTDSGSITFADLDGSDTPTATEVTQSVSTNVVGGLTGAQQTAIENAFSISPDALNANNGTINWTYTITEGELDFLAAGETVTAIFTITVNDANGGTDTQDVTINITGANDAPVITVVDVVGDITEGATLSDTGSITFADLDLTDCRPQPKSPNR